MQALGLGDTPDAGSLPTRVVRSLCRVFGKASFLRVIGHSGVCPHPQGPGASVYPLVDAHTAAGAWS